MAAFFPDQVHKEKLGEEDLEMIHPFELVKPFEYPLEKPEQYEKYLSYSLRESLCEEVDEVQSGQSSLLRVAARVLALSEDSDIFFIGRSVVPVQRTLEGLAKHTNLIARLCTLHISLRLDPEALRELLKTREFQLRLESFKTYARTVGFDPQRLAQSGQRYTLVDVVDTGCTFNCLIILLWRWHHELGLDWNAARRKLRVVAITHRGTFGDHDDVPVQWINLIGGPAVVQWVKVEFSFYQWLASRRARMAPKFRWFEWGSEAIAENWTGVFKHRLAGLQLEVACVTQAATPALRKQFVRLANALPVHSQPWFRSLLIQIAKPGRPVRTHRRRSQARGGAATRTETGCGPSCAPHCAPISFSPNTQNSYHFNWLKPIY
jgi:hypothetical protein